MKLPSQTAGPIPYLDLPAQMRSIRKDIDAAMARTLDHCTFCLGPDVAQFEKDFARFIGAEHCVGFNTGTSALHVALLLLNLGPGDEVITTPFTFVATSWAISYVGAKPVYVDIDDATFNLDPKLVERAITPRTKALMPVHLYGQPADMDPLLATCRKHNLPLVEDAAQAHGAKYRGRIAGTFGVMSGFSFYPGKNLGAYGEGGALITNDGAFAARARALRDHGSTQRYYHDEIGYNYRLPNINAALGCAQLEQLPDFLKAKRRLFERYEAAFTEVPHVRIVAEPEGCRSNYWLQTLLLDTSAAGQRNAILAATNDAGLMTRPAWILMHRLPRYRECPKMELPVSESLARRLINLPSSAFLIRS